jgi:hypothetical protein
LPTQSRCDSDQCPYYLNQIEVKQFVDERIDRENQPKY